MSKEAVKVQVSVWGDRTNPDFKGIETAGRFWPVGELITETLESDEGATGALQVDPDTNQVKKVFTLEQKLSQLKVLEGRKLVEGRWTEPGFPLENVAGNQNTAEPPKAPRLITLRILERRGADGVWESSKTGQPAAEQNKTGTQPQKTK